jgi:hypothetical protein
MLHLNNKGPLSMVESKNLVYQLSTICAMLKEQNKVPLLNHHTHILARVFLECLQKLIPIRGKSTQIENLRILDHQQKQKNLMRT